MKIFEWIQLYLIIAINMIYSYRGILVMAIDMIY